MVTKANFQEMIDWCSQGTITNVVGDTGTCMIGAMLKKDTPLTAVDPVWDGYLGYIPPKIPHFPERFQGTVHGFYMSIPAMSLSFSAGNNFATAIVGYGEIDIEYVHGWVISFPPYMCYCYRVLMPPWMLPLI